jgi:hypothetical protein
VAGRHVVKPTTPAKAKVFEFGFPCIASKYQGKTSKAFAFGVPLGCGRSCTPIGRRFRDKLASILAAAFQPPFFDHLKFFTAKES